MYDEEYIKSKVIENGGKEVEFNQQLELTNVYKHVRRSGALKFEALDKDLVTSDLLGISNPLSLIALTADPNPIEHQLELYDKNLKMAGTLWLTTQFVYREADPIPQGLNHKCYIQLGITVADFLEDADFLGKQDPYFKFEYGQDWIKTEVQDDAGKHAEFKDVFRLDDIYERILNGEEFQLNAYDEDVLSDDWLGATEADLWQSFVLDQERHEHELTLMDKKFKKTGTVKFWTQFVFVPIQQKPVFKADNANVLWKGCSTAHKEYQTEAMKQNFVMKVERFQAQNMQAKINKILKDEEKAKKILNEKLKEQEFIRVMMDQKMKH